MGLFLDDGKEARTERTLRRPSALAITPSSFQAELEAARAGYSRNVARLPTAEGNAWFIVLWPRFRLDHEPIYVHANGPLPRESRSATWLAQFSFSYDPARYERQAPARLRGRARLMAFLDGARETQTRPVRFISTRGHARHHDEQDEVAAEEQDVDMDEGGYDRR